MTRCSAEERALARASLYRLLALVFSYPTAETRAGLPDALAAARVAAELLGEPVAEGVERVRLAFEEVGDTSLEPAYQRVFTLSYSEECPAYETAFSAKHIFQQTSQQADIAGFYRAFGVNPVEERPDHLSLEVEFMYLLALKEAHARDLYDRGNTRICRDAQRTFLKRHLGRWAPLIGQRIAVTGAGTLYGVAGELLAAFSSAEHRFLRLGTVDLYRDEPVPIGDDEPGDFDCPMDEAETAEVASLPLYETRPHENVEEGRHVVSLPS